jgi:UDPglucose 6-dehydrogenase
MKIGVIGVGKVGSAISFGFQRIGHEVLQHDVKLNTQLKDVLTAQLVFVCVPTPQSADGHCNRQLVYDVVRDLAGAEYKGLIVVKSTVTPGTTDSLQSSWPNLRLAFCPEFLRERAAFSDFVENQDICIAGVYHFKDAELIAHAHGSLPKHFSHMRPHEAEFCKYFCNTFNALRIVFANQFYEVCKTVGADYAVIKNAVVKRENIGDHYLECNEQFRAFGGSCLPKDTAGFAAFIRDYKIDAPLFEQIVNINAGINEKPSTIVKFAKRSS